MDVCIHTDNKKYTIEQHLAKAFSHIDLSAPVQHSTVRNSDALNGRIWKGDEPVYWNLESDYEHLSTKQLENICKAAFLEPSFKTPLIIRRRKTADVQLKINWLGKKDEKFFTSPSILAFAYGPAGGLGGDITMNADALWLLRKTPLTAKEAKEKGYIDNFQFPDNLIRFYDPVHTMKHEGGHAIGMEHITDNARRLDTVMFPFYNGLHIFGEADLEYLTRLYGSASLPHWFKELIRTRILRL